jgi:hypothetical protein
MGPQFQLRSYQIDPKDMTAFLEVWRDRVVPLRGQFGLHTLQAWVSLDRDRFDWITYVDEGAEFATVEAVYLQSNERQSLDPDPVSWISAMTVTFVERFSGVAPGSVP